MTAPTNVTYYAPVTPGTYNVYADWTLVSPTGSESGQSIATITVTPVNPSVNVTGAWSGTLTITNWSPPLAPAPAAVDLTQDSTGVITGTFITPELEAICFYGNVTSLSMTGYVDGTNTSVSGSDDPEELSASIQASVDPSGQQMSGTFNIGQGNPDKPICPGAVGTIALAKQ